MITYKKMSLFDAPKGAMLMHACNAQGVWGSGIAKEFKKRFPESFENYSNLCVDSCSTTGIAFCTGRENGYQVVSLITSENYGDKKDSPEIIIIQTILALEDLFQSFNIKTIYCNKFNSGLFNVPWEKTEAVLKYFAKRYGVEFLVCDPEL